MVTEYLQPGNHIHTLGRGVLSIRVPGEDTWQDLFHIKEFSFNVATEELKHETLRSGLKTVDESAITKMEATGKFVVDVPIVDNVALFLFGTTMTDVTQNSGTWTDQVFSVAALDRWNSLGKKRCTITSVKRATYTCPATGTAGGGNTGNGTCTTVTAGTGIKDGTYTVTCTAEAPDSGTFEVKDPDGTDLGDATVGSAFTSSQINLTVNDGAVDFKVGDVFTIVVTVAAGAALTENTDYVLGDLGQEHGMIIPLSTSSYVGLVGKKFYVSGTYPSLTTKRIKAGGDENIIREFMFTSANQVGPLTEVYGYANLKPNGDMPMIGEEWQSFSFDFTCMSHTTYGSLGLMYDEIGEAV